MSTGVAPWGLGQGGGKASPFSPAGHPPGQLQQRCERVKMVRESCPVCDQPHGRLLQFGRWHSSEVQLHEYSWMKESASGRAMSEKHWEIGHHGETGISISALRVFVAVRFISSSCERLRKSFGQVPHRLGQGSWSKFLMWRLERASSVSRSFGSLSHCVPQWVQGGPPACSVSPQNCLLQGFVGRVFDVWTDVIFSVADFFILTHHLWQADLYEACCLSPITLRARFGSQSLSTNTRFVCAICPRHPTYVHWLHCGGFGPRVPSVCHGHPNKAQVLSLSLLTVDVSYFFHQCWSTMEQMFFRAEVESSHRWFRRGKDLHNATSGLGKDLCPASCCGPTSWRTCGTTRSRPWHLARVSVAWEQGGLVRLFAEQGLLYGGTCLGPQHTFSIHEAFLTLSREIRNPYLCSKLCPWSGSQPWCQTTRSPTLVDTVASSALSRARGWSLPDRPLRPGYSSTSGSVVLPFSIRGMMVAAAAGQTKLSFAKDNAEFVWLGLECLRLNLRHKS